MKLGTLEVLVGDPWGIIFRLGTNSEMSPGDRHFEFQYGRHIVHTFAYNFETKADRNVILMPTSTFLGSRNSVKSLL